MAPKGTKRAAAQAPADQPEAKQFVYTLKKCGITKSVFKSVTDIVDHEMANLPDPCRKMLIAAIPHSICVPSDARLEQQAMCVEMLGELAESIQQKLQEAFEAEHASLADIEAKKERLEAQVQSAEATLMQATEAATSRKEELAEAYTFFAGKREAVILRRAEQKKGDAEIVAVRADKDTLKGVLAGSFRKLKAGEWEAGTETQLFKDVKSITGKLQVEESMLTALSSTLTKAPDARGQFDQMVVGQFESALQSKIGQLAEAELGEAAGAAARAAAVEAAQGEQAAAASAQQEAAAVLTRAQEEQDQVGAALEAAQGQLLVYGPEYAQATAARDQKQLNFELFRDHNVANFRRLREHVSKAQEEKLAAEAAAAEGAEAEAAPVKAGA